MKKNKVEDETEKTSRVGFFSLFRYATFCDICWLIVTSIFAFSAGLLVPGGYIIFGNLINTFLTYTSYEQCENATIQCTEFNTDDSENVLCWTNKMDACLKTNHTLNEISELMKKVDSMDILTEFGIYAKYFAYIGASAWLAEWFAQTVNMLNAARQAQHIKIAYFRALLRQDVGFHDTNESAVAAQRVTEDIKKIEEALGIKFTITVKCLGTFFGGVGLGLYYNYKFALVLFAIIPLIVTSGYVMFAVDTRIGKSRKIAYSSAHALAEEVFSGIRTITAFGKQEECCQRYNKELLISKTHGIRAAPLRGLGMGFFSFSFYLVLTVGFYYGGRLISNEGWSAGDMMAALFSIFIGIFNLSLASTNIDYFTAAIESAVSVFEIIQRIPPIDKYSTEGIKPAKFTSEILFKDITFNYPTRTEEIILRNFSCDIKAGQTVAFVGSSGSGKSTVMKLLQRYYEYQNGDIFVSGSNIKDLNLHYLRNKMGVVNQEPILFDMTVRENIRMGNMRASNQDIEDAAKQANALDFIMQLPMGFESQCGQGGSLLSGGQKQRISIARALLRNPDILLFDEATSALDAQSEKIVQDTMNAASLNRTTIMVAHRLATVKNADNILVMKNGIVVEQGTYDQLLENNGYFATLASISDAAENVSEETKPVEVHETLKTNIKKEKEAEIECEHTSNHATFWKLMKMNKNEIWYIILGCFAAFLVGSAEPISAIVMSDFIKSFAIYELGSDELERDILNWSMVSLGIGCVLFCFQIIEFSGLGKAGEELTFRLRKKTFRCMIGQDMSYFDKTENSVGVLCSRLSTDATNVQSATGVRVANVIKNFMTLFVSLFIGIYFCWQITLMSMVFIPVIGVATIIVIKQFSGDEAGGQNKATELCQHLASESIRNITTVTSLNCEMYYETAFSKGTKQQTKSQTRKAMIVGCCLSMVDSNIFFSFSLSFWFGAWMIDNGHLALNDFENIFKAILAVIFAAIVMGQNTSFMPNIGEATSSCNRLFALFERKSLISPFSTSGKQPASCMGKLNFQKANFFYPTRRNAVVLDGLSLTVYPGQTIAIVGQSGQGKSTIIQLIERFYDITGGSVTLDGNRLPDLNIKWLRGQIGLVSQEPILLNMSIKDNIIFGAVEDVTDEEIVNCCKTANAHNFITELEHGYDTVAGERGSQLSGGQKQRIAIARTLIRNPKILLLDEATSALDNESQSIVQNALERARDNRTCIIVAHRLSTIRNADLICVLHDGKIVEIGTHTGLLNLNGEYYKLVKEQL